MNDNEEQKEIYVKVTKDGPYLVYDVPLIKQKTIVTDKNKICVGYGDNKTFEVKMNPAAICRCGNTKNAPFCDGSHTKIDFDGTETASFDPITKDAKTYEGPNLILKDNEKFCAFARFCDAHGSIWNLVFDGTPESDQMAEKESFLCPAGRLLIFDKEGNLVEEKLEQAVSILEDEGLKISGPIWLTGRIRVESENGRSYELRNKQTLCRCGKSKNKPFCDSTHRHIKFKT